MRWKFIIAGVISAGSLALISFTSAAPAQVDLEDCGASLRSHNSTLSAGSQSKTFPAKFTNRYRMEFVLIPGGKFVMGSAAGDDDEKPAHEVTIAQPFYIGRYEVTQWQWRAAMTTTVDEQRRKIKNDAKTLVASPMAGEGDERATYYVNWQEAHAFVEQLNALKDGHTYRLPSEAEWEYVCRAGSTEDRPADVGPLAWYKNNSNNYVQFVGMRRANAFQIYDLIGNVWEWCEDVFHLKYDGAPADGSPWMTKDELNQRVKRGGSFMTRNFDFLRCSARTGEMADSRDVETGFRVVATTTR
jgi:formylglycine-generating enzyme required for sulfatase activity